MSGAADSEAEHAAGLTAVTCIVAALVAFVIGSAAAHPREGLALGAGLALGSGNGHLARRLLGSLVPFGASSIGRLVMLSVVAIGVGFVMGVDVMWLVVLGLGLAQLILAFVSARAVLSG